MLANNRTTDPVHIRLNNEAARRVIPRRRAEAAELARAQCLTVPRSSEQDHVAHIRLTSYSL